MLDVGITEEILTTDLIGGIRGYVDMSRKYLESSTSSITPTQLNDYMADNYEDSLTEEQRIAMAEFDVLLAKHGQTPARSVEGILGKTLDNDRLAKAIEAHKDSLRIIWQKAVRPILRPTIKTIVIVTIIGMTFSYFVETSGTEMYTILKPVNSLRHFIFDPIWGTIVKKFPQANT
ncbi:MAG: hypothetical protein Q4B27_05100 [Candidatus Saccharibacteria bacterium]|nr:hypothetical protein [Candidatus Saccharibacteria bacterium]